MHRCLLMQCLCFTFYFVFSRYYLIGEQALRYRYVKVLLMNYGLHSICSASTFCLGSYLDGHIYKCIICKDGLMIIPMVSSVIHHSASLVGLENLISMQLQSFSSGASIKNNSDLHRLVSTSGTLVLIISKVPGTCHEESYWCY